MITAIKSSDKSITKQSFGLKAPRVQEEPSFIARKLDEFKKFVKEVGGDDDDYFEDLIPPVKK